MKRIPFHEVKVDLRSVLNEFNQRFGFPSAEVFAHGGRANIGFARLKAIGEKRIEQRFDDRDIDGRAARIAKVSAELKVHPLRVIGVGMVPFDIPFDPAAFDHVVMGPENRV